MKKFDAVISRIEETILATAIIAMAIILIGGVISRTVFNASWGFTEEVSTGLTTLVTFFAIGYCARKARHISMSIVFDLVNEKAKKAMMVIVTVVTFGVMAFLTWLSIDYVATAAQLGRVTPSLRIPVWIMTISVPIGFGFAALEYLRSAILNIIRKDIYISSQFRLGENTDEALGLSESGEV